MFLSSKDDRPFCLFHAASLPHGPDLNEIPGGLKGYDANNFLMDAELGQYLELLERRSAKVPTTRKEIDTRRKERLALLVVVFAAIVVCLQADGFDRSVPRRSCRRRRVARSPPRIPQSVSEARHGGVVVSPLDRSHTVRAGGPVFGLGEINSVSNLFRRAGQCHRESASWRRTPGRSKINLNLRTGHKAWYLPAPRRPTI